LRVAILGTKSLPARHGGFETCVEELGTRLVERGHQVYLYCRHPRGKPLLPYRGIHQIPIPEFHNKYLATLLPTFLSVLKVLFGRVDVVHVFGVGNACLVPLLRLFRKRTAISVDGLDWKRSKWKGFASWFLRSSQRWACWFANALILDSRVVMRYYEETYGLRKLHAYIPYGGKVKESTGTEALAGHGLHDRGYYLFVGRLKPEKNVHLLIEAFEKVKTDLDLAIVGDDEFSPDYIARLKRTKDPRVKFLGYVYGSDYAQINAHCYLYVTASELEGTSPALLGAMGYGSCVVVNGIPENLETIGNAGLSFRHNDTEDLRRILQELADNPGRVAQYRELARERVRLEYSWEGVADKYEALYRELVGAALHGRPGPD